jgi:thymidine kinase
VGGRTYNGTVPRCEGVEPGEIWVYFGPMFSGKTEALIGSLRRERDIAGKAVQVFKPVIDDRGEGLNIIKSKDGREFPATPIYSAKEILKKLKKGVETVGIDEVQFLAPGLIAVVRELAEGRGIKVAVAGLPTDFRGEPFGAMPELMAIAQKRLEFTAVCTYREAPGMRVCGAEATQTQRLIDGMPARYDDSVVVVGGKELYEARCIKHHLVPRG